MSRRKTSEYCGVRWCSYPAKTKGLCGTHYKDHLNNGEHPEAVANDEITRSLLKQPAYHKTHLHLLHRRFAASLPISRKQRQELTKALNETAKKRGSVK
jgi:hypothetical protein